MLDLLLLFIFLLFFIIGLKRPYIAFMGYTWVDTIRPWQLSHGFLRGWSLSMLMTVVCLLSLLINIRKLRWYRSNIIVALMLLFFIWITVSTFYLGPLFPMDAVKRWGFNYKVLLISILVPLAINKCRHLEALILVWLFTISFFILSIGPKAIMGGAGYGRDLLIGGGNSYLAESSTLASIAVGIIPILLFIRGHSILFRGIWFSQYLWIGMIINSVFTAIGSFARTGIVGFLVYVLLTVWKTKHKVLISLLILVLAFGLYQVVPDSYKARMDTIKSPTEESSAQGRILVWRWTLDFIKRYPLGGGFESYQANRGKWGNYAGGDAGYLIDDRKAKAHHSIYFNLLGDLGYPGLIIYLLILFFVFNKLRFIRVMSESLHSSNASWMHFLAKASSTTLIILHVCGAFINVAFYPFFIYFFITVTLSLEKVYYSELEQIVLSEDADDSVYIGV